uniref:Uncharacterized protein n=1 Tax=Echinococcus granulosus TaxID=6210 RepID=A0A068X4L1_ECHGR|nr:hypothetical protein EgrG_002050700 [Echinococcus granulosus]
MTSQEDKNERDWSCNSNPSTKLVQVKPTINGIQKKTTRKVTGGRTRDSACSNAECNTVGAGGGDVAVIVVDLGLTVVVTIQHQEAGGGIV